VQMTQMWRFLKINSLVQNQPSGMNVFGLFR